MGVVEVKVSIKRELKEERDFPANDRKVPLIGPAAEAYKKLAEQDKEFRPCMS